MGKINWITKNMTETASDYLNGGLGFFQDWIISIFDGNIEIFKAAEVEAATLVTKSVSIVLVIIMTFKYIWSTYVMEMDGDPDQDPLQVFVKASVCLAVIEGNSVIFDLFNTISKKFTADMAGACDAHTFCLKFSSVLSYLTMSSVKAAILVIILAICLILVIIFSFKAGLRAGELMLMKIVFPLFSIDKLSANQERWNAFFTSYVVTFFSYSLQLFCIRIGLNRVIAALIEGESASFINYFSALVCFWLAIKTPKWLEKWVYSSGIGQAIGNTGRTMTYMIPTILMRRH